MNHKYQFLYEHEPAVGEENEQDLEVIDTRKSDDSGLNRKPFIRSCVSSTLSYILATVVLACTLLEIYLIFYILSHPKADLSGLDVAPHELKYLSSYVGFDRLYRNKTSPTKYDPIINRARAILQVSSEEPHTVFPVLAPMYLAYEGYIPAAQNMVLVTPEVSSIAQFRVMDYGMENCSLVLSVPPQESTKTHIQISDRDGPNAVLDVWSLSAERALDPKTLSWDTKPRRRRYIGAFSVSYGANEEFPSFRCSSGSYHTFELSCAGACHVNITSTGWNDEVLYLRQSQTI